jgi:hypothetical protein
MGGARFEPGGGAHTRFADRRLIRRVRDWHALDLWGAYVAALEPRPVALSAAA